MKIGHLRNNYNQLNKEVQRCAEEQTRVPGV